MSSCFDIPKSTYPLIQVLLGLVFLRQNILLHVVVEHCCILLLIFNYLVCVVFLKFVDDAVFYMFSIVLGEIILIVFLVRMIPRVKVYGIIFLITRFAVLVEALL